MNKYHTFWRRLGAAFIDGIILYPLVFIETTAYNSTSKSFSIIGIFIASFVYIIYFVILHAKYGQTIGKKLMNIKVVAVTEVELIGFKRAVLREFPWIIANGLAFLYLFGYLFKLEHRELNDVKEYFRNLTFMMSFAWLFIELISMFTNSKRRAIHDWFAKSVVIKM